MKHLLTVAASAALLATAAHGQTAVERGRYLVETIGACGDCHTPKDRRGMPIAAEKFAGGFVIREKPLDAVAPAVMRLRPRER